MPKPLRYTGTWPPLDVLDAYPNWVFASDEESEPDQDETTIKPESRQSWISEETDCTAALATLANGSSAEVIISLLNGNVEGVDVWDGRDWWALRLSSDQTTWTPLEQPWLPPDERRPVVSLSDASVFPVSIVSRLPAVNGTYLRVDIPLKTPPRYGYR